MTQPIMRLGSVLPTYRIRQFRFHIIGIGKLKSLKHPGTSNLAARLQLANHSTGLQGCMQLDHCQDQEARWPLARSTDKVGQPGLIEWEAYKTFAPGARRCHKCRCSDLGFLLSQFKERNSCLARKLGCQKHPQLWIGKFESPE